MPSHSETDRRALLELARRAIAEAVSLRRAVGTIPRTGVFAERRGVFVSLHARGRLRGCIGIVEATEPLGEAIARCAASAAQQDPRFSPVGDDELQALQIEISLLSVPEPILPENIEIGKHGLLISLGAKRGLLLPQVAVEHKLSREKFLEETCRKAGLEANAWREPATRVEGFSCEVFSEDASAAEETQAAI
ncbi:MAG TPA: AmmeMemoRadiSam system protein A [Candidatus Acidoferrum sp.]|nr:AmmeMemoRadiSam system protein A [Candidatus Acidoferrum sp.]